MRENQEALDKNRWLLQATGVLDHIGNRIEALRRKTGSIENKARPLQPPESADKYMEFLVAHSSSKNLIRSQQAVADKSSKLGAEIAMKQVAELEALKSEELNLLFEGTSLRLGDLYDLKKPRGM